MSIVQIMGVLCTIVHVLQHIRIISKFDHGNAPET